MAQDPYLELGVPRTATGPEIRKAFHKLAKQLHPDKNPGDAKSEERFKRVSAAFDLLGDEEKRKKFDRGQIDADGRETMGGGFNPFSRGNERGAPGGGYGGGMEFEGVDLDDILGDMLGRGGRARGGFGAGGPFHPQPKRGADVRARLEIDLEDAVRGGKQRISFSDGRMIDVNIPKGASDGQVLRLKEQGAPGRAGPGDALIELAIRPHPVYRREGETLVMDLPVSAPDAILGGKVEAPTPEGPVTLTIPPHSNSGQTLRLKGRGLTDGRTGQRGDLMARIMVTLPDPPDPELDKFAQTWRDKRPYKPRRK